MQFFILFQVLVIALYSFLSACGEGSFYGGMYPEVQLQWFSPNEKSHGFWWGSVEGNWTVTAFFFYLSV